MQLKIKEISMRLTQPTDVIDQNEKGAVLVTVMLILLVMAMLVMSWLQSSLMEIKMSANYASKAAALYIANSKLDQYEAKLAQGEKVSSAEIISNDICGVTIYRVTASAVHGSSKSDLESTFAKLGDASHCDPKPTILQGRQSWRFLD